MSDFTNYLEEALINHVFRDTSFAQPDTIFVSLHVAATTEVGGGSEVSGNSYARQAVVRDNNEWTDPSSGTQGETDNASDITFPQATGDWTLITHVALWDAATTGNMLFHGSLNGNKTVSSADTFKFAAGALNVQFA